MKNFWKSKINIIQAVIIGILAIVILLSNFSLVTQFLGRLNLSGLNPLASYQKRLDRVTEKLKLTEQRNVILEFDRMCLEDAANILLAIQDFYFQKNTFPGSLEDLKKGGYLDPSSHLIDPGTNQPYFYEKREQDFVLCVWLSDMLKGVNTASCPSNSNRLSINEQNKTAMPVENKTAELEIVGNTAYVNIRAKPNTNSDIIARVKPGDIFVFQDVKDNWYQISATKEKIGWINGDFVKVLKSP